jgi:hypothetical protein
VERETRLRLAAGNREELSKVLYDHTEEVLFVVLENPRLEEQQALVLLARKELTYKVLERFALRPDLVKSYRVKLALARHPHTPRSVSLPLMRHLFVFDLVKVATTPAIPADVRRIVEEQIASRAPTLSLGEKLTLARQASGHTLAALLTGKETTVVRAALDNPRMTEELIARAFTFDTITAESVELVAGHKRWSNCYNLKLALMRNPQTSLARVLEMAEEVLVSDLRDIIHDPRMPAPRRNYLQRWINRRARTAGRE